MSVVRERRRERLLSRPRLWQLEQLGLLGVIGLLGLVLTLLAGSHSEPETGRLVNNFFNPHTLLQTATDASFFAIMAVGATGVIISGGIDLSVGSVFALAGVGMALTLRAWQSDSVGLALALCAGIGLACGLFNGLLIVSLRVHPFIVTLGAMWIFRGLAFVVSRAESILVPDSLTRFAKYSCGLPETLTPLPLLAMLVIAAGGSLFLTHAVMGRYIFAVGGNPEAARYAGLPTGRVLTMVYALAGLTAGLAAFLGVSYYGSASCADATGYELYVIASAVVGGVSLSGGKGSVISAMLGAILITLIRQSIRTLHFDQNYEWIIIGWAIIIAVVLDRLGQRLREQRLAQTAGV